MRMQAPIETNPAKRVTVLSVSPVQEDRFTMQSIFNHSNWVLYHADPLASALAILHEHEIGVVLCERDLRPGSWVDLLDRLRLLPVAPPLIVTSRHADDKLWAEALNLGAYDVLAKPFDQRELVRTVSMAWLHWVHKHENGAGKMKVAAAS